LIGLIMAVQESIPILINTDGFRTQLEALLSMELQNHYHNL
jgi:hypothetical protein